MPARLAWAKALNVADCLRDESDGGQAPGVLQHVMARGIERRKIFMGDKDRTSFLERLALILEDTQTQCYAWALIPNPARLAWV